MAHGTTRTPEKDAKFLELVSQGASVGTAARGAGYARRSVYRWRGADAELAAAWESALEAGTDGLEDEALRRAKDGWAEPRFYQGELCGHVQKYSDGLLIALLKARRPEKYSDRAQAKRAQLAAMSWPPPERVLHYSHSAPTTPAAPPAPRRL